MSILRLARRYAQSMVDLAKADNKLEQINQDMSYVEQVVQTPDFADFLRNPLFSIEKKEQVFKAVFANKVQDLTMRALNTVLQHKRERYLLDICQLFHVLYNKECHISAAKLTTAVPVSDATIQGILSEFKQAGMLESKVDLETVVDPSILGGFILQFDDQVYDASLSAKVGKLRAQFSQNLYIKNL